jgi:hypothetical protein
VTPEQEARFWSKVYKRGPEECWLWGAGRSGDGYGASVALGREQQTGSHRVAWMIENGPIPNGLCVCHRCDTPLCCNPRHLFLGSSSDNTADRHSKGRDARGDKSGLRLHPERAARGDRNGSRLHPECLNPPIGERSGHAKLSCLDVVAIRHLIASGYETKYVARTFGISDSEASRIYLRTRWAHVK